MDVAGGCGGVAGVDGGEFRGVGVWGGGDEGGGGGGWVGGGGFGGEVGLRGGGGAFHGFVVEAVEDVKVFVDGDVGDDGGLGGIGCGLDVSGVDAVEGEKRVGIEDADEVFSVKAVYDQSFVFSIGVKFHCVQHVLCPQDLDSPFRVIGIENAKDHVPLGQEDGVDISSSDVFTGQGCQDRGFPGLA